jgi:hypothetical protein
MGNLRVLCGSSGSDPESRSPDWATHAGAVAYGARAQRNPKLKKRLAG